MHGVSGHAAALGVTCIRCAAIVDVWSPIIRISPAAGGQVVFTPPSPGEYVCPACWLESRDLGTSTPEAEGFLRHRSIAREAGIPLTATTVVLDLGLNHAKAWTRRFDVQVYAVDFAGWPHGTPDAPDRPFLRLLFAQCDCELFNFVVFAARIGHRDIPDAVVQVIWPFTDLWEPRMTTLLGFEHVTAAQCEKLKRGLGFFNATFTQRLRNRGRQPGYRKVKFKEIVETYECLERVMNFGAVGLPIWTQSRPVEAQEKAFMSPRPAGNVEEPRDTEKRRPCRLSVG